MGTLAPGLFKNSAGQVCVHAKLNGSNDGVKQDRKQRRMKQPVLQD